MARGTLLENSFTGCWVTRGATVGKRRDGGQGGSQCKAQRCGYGVLPKSRFIFRTRTAASR
ncbi:MAG: hypothetical protein AAGA19_03030 [Pseudomonadota bacterium]